MTHKKILLLLTKQIYKSDKNIICKFCKKLGDINHVSKTFHRVYLSCGHYINPLKNTIMYKTRIKLTRWWEFFIQYKRSTLSTLVASNILNISRMGAWKIMQKIKKETPLIQIDNDSTLQIDELFLGSPKHNHHKQKLSNNELIRYNNVKKFKSRKRNITYDKKEVIFGIASSDAKYKLLRSGIYSSSMDDLKSKRLRIYWEYYWAFILRQHAKHNNFIYHDGDKTVSKIIANEGLLDDTVLHGKDEYVKVNNNRITTTNKVEGMFGRFKRQFKGVQTHSKNWTNLYLREYSFRASNRNIKLMDFVSLILYKV